MSGKGSNRRNEDAAKVEANWPTVWDARERPPEDVLRCTCAAGGDCLVCDGEN